MRDVGSCGSISGEAPLTPEAPESTDRLAYDRYDINRSVCVFVYLVAWGLVSLFNTTVTHVALDIACQFSPAYQPASSRSIQCRFSPQQAGSQRAYGTGHQAYYLQMGNVPQQGLWAVGCMTVVCHKMQFTVSRRSDASTHTEAGLCLGMNMSS